MRHKGGRVVAQTEQQFSKGGGWFKLHPPPPFIQNTVARRRVTAGAADRNVRAGSANQAFNKRRYPPSISHTAEEEAGPCMIFPQPGLFPPVRLPLVAGFRPTFIHLSYIHSHSPPSDP